MVLTSGFQVIRPENELLGLETNTLVTWEDCNTRRG